MFFGIKLIKKDKGFDTNYVYLEANNVVEAWDTIDILYRPFWKPIKIWSLDFKTFTTNPKTKITIEGNPFL